MSSGIISFRTPPSQHPDCTHEKFVPIELSYLCSTSVTSETEKRDYRKNGSDYLKTHVTRRKCDSTDYVLVQHSIPTNKCNGRYTS